MPKTLKRVVYDGYAKEYTRNFSNGEKVVLKKGIVTIVPDHIHKILMDGKRIARIVNVIGIEDKYHSKLSKRMIREG